MPIDPAIALQVKPIQIESPLSGFQKAIALKNSVNAQALQEQQAEENRINIEAGKLGLDSAKLKLDQDRRAADDNDLLTATTMKHTTYDDTDGLKTDDDAVIKSLMAAGKPALASAYAKNQAEIKTAMTTKVIKDLELDLKQKERLGSWAATLHNASPADKPRLWPVVLQGIAAERLLPAEQLAQFPPQYSPEMDPQIEAFVQQSKTSTVQATEHLAKLNAQREAAENLPKLLTAAGQILGAATNDAEWAQGLTLVDPKVRNQFSQTYSPAEAERAATLALTPEQRMNAGKGPKTAQDALAMVDQIFSPTDKDPSMIATNRRYKGMLSALNFTPAAAQKIIDQAAEERKSVSVAQNTAPIKIQTAVGTDNAKAAELTGQALDIAVQNYLNDKTLPRSVVMQAKVIAAAGDWLKANGMSAQAAVEARRAADASKKAMDDLTKTNAQVEAFSNTARKNMDILQKAADAIGGRSPILNQPIRTLNQKVMGDPKISALLAALIPAQTDIAKILNSTNGTGVLTDDSRHEMERALGKDATPAMFKAALDIFRKDMENRKVEYAAMLKDLREHSTVAGNAEPQKPAGERGLIVPGGALEKLLPKK